MKHPRLCIVILFFLNQLFVEEFRRSLYNICPHVDPRFACECHSPNDVGSHEMIAFALFPPSPTTVGMLKIVKALQTSLGHGIELFEIVSTFRMSLCGCCCFDAAKYLIHHTLGLYSEIAKGLRRNYCGQEPAHRLFRAAIWVINKVWQCIKHCRRHAWSNLNSQVSGICSSLLRNIELDCDAVAAHLSRPRDELLDAVLVDGKGLLHCIRILFTTCFNLYLRFACMCDSDEPVNSCFTVGLNVNLPLFAFHSLTINNQ